MVECTHCRHFVAADSPLCSACGTPRSGIFHTPHATRHPALVQPRRWPRIRLSITTKIVCIFIFSLGVAMLSWQQRYGEWPTSLHVSSQFFAEAGSYFVGSMPFAVIPRSAGLLFGLAVLILRATLV
jgi:hypothetical protein